jgi:YidC/Oxa1 family membrane protein insertase
LKRRTLFVILLLLSVVILSGCTLQPQSMESLRDGNFFFSTFAYPMAVLLGWLHDYLGNYGLAILGLTIIIRLIVLPLAIKQYKSMKGMQKIQPQMMQLREKYKDDRQQMQVETMKLMQENGVNPAAGCLPLLIQMPVLFALYYAINIVEVVGGTYKGETFAGETFLWFELGKQDSTFILPILAAITTIIPMLISSQTNNNPQMKIMLYIFPVMIFFFSWQLPAALPLYWVYSNIFTTIQTYFIYRERPNAIQNGSGTIESSSAVSTTKTEKKKKRRKR